jgi:hypothetical protein
MQQAPINNIEDLRRFMFAGKARFTIRSKRTGTRFTYRVKVSKDEKVFFVSVLTGAENETHYLISERTAGAVTRTVASQRSVLTHRVLSRFSSLARCLDAKRLHDQLEVWHEGRCGRCGRTLTVPESIASGIGPECATRDRHFMCEAA